MSMKEEYTAIDMSTAAADGFRDGQRAAQSAPALSLPAAGSAELPEPDFALDGGSQPCYYAETVQRIVAALSAQQSAQRDWPDDEIVEAWRWCEENGGTPAEFLSHSLLVKRSRVLGRPLTWREAIELTAITTNMPDEERDKLLAIDDEQDAAAQDQGEVQRLRVALEWAVDRWHAEVASRPLVNVHRRALDDTWRQIIRRLGGDAGLLCGPAHDELLALAASTGQEVEK